MSVFFSTLLFLGASFAGQTSDVPQRLEPIPAGLNSRTKYILGPEDQLIIRALDAEEISEKPIRIDASGYIRLPLVGNVLCAGLTIEQLQDNLTLLLKPYIKHPNVSVSVTELHSQPVSVIGAVKKPGIHQVQGRKTLVEVLAEAGGLETDAGQSVKIVRKQEWGRIPLKSAVDDDTGHFSIAELSIKGFMDARNPVNNIDIEPQDVIYVPRADMVYVVGEVKKAGGFLLRERENVSVLQALSLAEGLSQTASPKNARILRTEPTSTKRTEIAVDLRKILAGTATDVPMHSDDILFVPNDAAKSATLRAVEAAIQVGTGLVIWRH